jgi:ActR/RegA family two-component response regulator
MPFFGRHESPVKNDKSASYHQAMRTQILLVEDEPTISEPLAESLGRDGFEAEVASTLAWGAVAVRTSAAARRLRT